MRFSLAWAKVASQNVTLKVATVALVITSLGEFIIIGRLALRDPLVIERSCYSRVVSAKQSDPTYEEIRSFLLEALPMRFDSNGFLKDGFLSIEETVAREKEQSTLRQRQMIQKIIVSDVKNEGKDILVFSDRLMSVGKIKSALPLNLKVKVQNTNRSEANPYGLILTSISQIEEKADKQ